MAQEIKLRTASDQSSPGAGHWGPEMAAHGYCTGGLRLIMRENAKMAFYELARTLKQLFFTLDENLKTYDFLVQCL